VVGTEEGSAPTPDRHSRRERVASWVRQKRERLEVARADSTTVGFAFDAFSYDTDTGAPVLAAALGFRVFLFQVPFVCFFLIVAGYLADLIDRDPRALFHGGGIAQLTAESVTATSNHSDTTRAIAFLLVGYALFLGARSFVKVLHIVHALVFIAFVAVAVGLAGLVDRLRYDFLVNAILSILVTTLVPFFAWWYVSWWLPHRDCPLIALMPGAALFAIGAVALQIASVVWLPHHLASKSDEYGTLGVSIALLLWAYLLGRVITLAAVFNAALWARFGTESEHPVDLRRPSWQVPLLDGVIGRLWTWMFGNDRRRDEGQRDDTGRNDTGPDGETTPDPAP
jgi:uncharacterized BrkB/YihY/UPF0761 family membrane protein